MATLINGRLVTNITHNNNYGEFIRAETTFRETIPSTNVESNRYQLYVSYACPWAHRTIIVRNLKGLQQHIPMSVTDPLLGDKGWTLSDNNGLRYLAVLYISSNPHFSGKVTVPLLWDKKSKRIINNESSEIMRIFNSSFNHLTDSEIELCPMHLIDEINNINAKVYENINNAVYQTGFATTQRAYNENNEKLFIALEDVDNLLKKQQFLVGDKLTESDIRLFTTLIRFDCVYYLHFKCNWKMIRDYHYLYNYMKSIYQIPEVKETCRFDQIKEHYYRSHQWINPYGIIPSGPEEHLDTPHDRGRIAFHRLINS